MALVVQKYGGTSVADIERIQAVAKRISRSIIEGHRLVVVVSAMSGETDRLLALGRSVSEVPSAQMMDILVSTGEQVSSALLALALQDRGHAVLSLCGWQIPITTDAMHGKARIEDIDVTRLEGFLESYQAVVVAGFQGISSEGRITTMGRGGSDTTAVALAAALSADECQIYTDVDGVYTTDPRVVDNARRLDSITFEEMLEMSSLGSKVLQIRSVEFAGKYHVPLRVLSSFTEGVGTLIRLDKEDDMEQPEVSGIAFNCDEAKLTVRGVPDVPGAAYQILGPIGEASIEVDMIVQNIGAENNTTDFTFTVHRRDFDQALKILLKISEQLGGLEVIGDANIGKVSLVGVAMRSHAGIASRMFKVFADENINILMISTSEIKVSVVVEQKYIELAVRALHTAFQLEKP